MAPKRKASAELSTNPATIKSRNRTTKLANDQYAAEVEKAKTRDQAAVTYQKKKLVKTQAWLNANPAERIRLTQESKERVLHKRAQLGIDWHAKAKELGIGEDGGLFARVDDGNIVWEDIEFDEHEEQKFEKMWRSDEKANNERAVDLVKGAKAKGQAAIRKAIQKRTTSNQVREFMQWQDTWRSARTTLGMKLRYIISNDKKPMWNDKIIPPGLLFDEEEKALWRNFSTWAWPKSEWVDLPGPASWWPDDLEEIDRAGFTIPKVVDDNRYRQAYNLVRKEFGRNVPLKYELVMPFNPPTLNKLILGKDCLKTRNQIQDYWFGRLGKPKVGRSKK